MSLQAYLQQLAGKHGERKHYIWFGELGADEWMIFNNLHSQVLSCVFSPSQGGLLGAGTGAGSCAAAPYRSSSVNWSGGCPAYAECCTEFGYCHDRVSLGDFGFIIQINQILG